MCVYCFIFIRPFTKHDVGQDVSRRREPCIKTRENLFHTRSHFQKRKEEKKKEKKRKKRKKKKKKKKKKERKKKRKKKEKKRKKERKKRKEKKKKRKKKEEEETLHYDLTWSLFPSAVLEQEAYRLNKVAQQWQAHNLKGAVKKKLQSLVQRRIRLERSGFSSEVENSAIVTIVKSFETRLRVETRLNKCS